MCKRTLGNETKVVQEEEQAIAEKRKSQCRWAALATLLVPDDADGDGSSAVASKVRSIVSGQSGALLPPHHGAGAGVIGRQSTS